MRHGAICFGSVNGSRLPLVLFLIPLLLFSTLLRQTGGLGVPPEPPRLMDEVASRSRI
jgi:hypothetical protein